MAQWLERGALSMSLPAGRFRTPLGAGFSDISCFSLLNNLGHSFDVVSLGKAHHPQMLKLDSGENEYLVGQKWQCVR